MRAKAEESLTAEARAVLLALEARWLRLAEAAEKPETDPGSEGIAAS